MRRARHIQRQAGSDHLVRAWGRTYGLPIIVTTARTITGLFTSQLIPLDHQRTSGQLCRFMGQGAIRDWLYVEDHARALVKVVTEGQVGETYNIGGHNEKRNIDVVTTLCAILDELAPSQHEGIDNYKQLITHVADRPGHDLRYAIDASKIERELGWTPEETFETGLRKTVEWYLANESWWRNVLDGSYQGERLGLGD